MPPSLSSFAARQTCPAVAARRSFLIGRLIRLGAVVAAAAVLDAAEPAQMGIASPTGQLVVDFSLKADGAPVYAIRRAGQLVLAESRLGLRREDADFSRGLRLRSAAPTEVAQETYELLTGKRRINHYRATRKILHLESAAGQPLDLVFQVSEDGVAFRYVFPDVDTATHRLQAETTSFHFPAGTRAWLQPIAAAKTGFAGTNPSYEEYYERDVPVGAPCPTGAGWVYPALFRVGDTWLLISEAGLGRTYCGTRLHAEAPDGEYAVAFADPREILPGGAAGPESPLPWASPWRLIVVGSLRTIVESTLGTDLADKPAAPAAETDPEGPGKAAWSWPLLGDLHTTFDVQRRFIDYAAAMGWKYTLIDAGWDQQIGYGRIQELTTYAAARGVRILLWYNSAGEWNATPQTPRGRLLTHEGRMQEFTRLKLIGIAGLKVDFFGGDGQSMIGYYHDLLQDSAACGLLMNFHGATLPRGWQRTYPNLMTMEAVRGLEYVTFEQGNADAEPAHAAMLPFTRNVFDPMDFTPVVLDRVNDRIVRRTTSAFELALAVLFTSGIQHYAETPDGMARAPDYVRACLRAVPSIWDEVAFIDGDPGRFIVLARRAEGRWWVAGINGEAGDRDLLLDLRRVAGTAARGTLITDDGPDALGFQRRAVALTDGTCPLRLRGHGGFVLELE